MERLVLNTLPLSGVLGNNSCAGKVSSFKTALGSSSTADLFIGYIPVFLKLDRRFLNFILSSLVL